MAYDDAQRKARMSANLADFLELLSVTRTRIVAAGQRPTDIPDNLKAALLRLISE